MNDMTNLKPGTSPEQATVRHERVLPGPIERVWAYLTDSEKRKTWLASGVFDLRVGGKADLHFDHSNITSEKAPDEYKGGKHDSPGTITRLDPPRLLSYTFGAAGPESEVTFELEPRGKGVLLVITHRRIADRKTMINVAGGWDVHVGILEDRLNGEEPRPFWSNHARLKKEYEARL
jgi:uncharacterized protein YndB with AHSA1/START domain